eukprot:TRINITY_DN17431_c0_g1_i1.p1 TRINITY_DN17431_c0_g1~~TRINITY_DN17431_c0_g1_i1.p1  ORF type:complete len:587 (-),score=155.37 TRINITY_DN17431_c0_g1_i1:51-1757(-)
MTDSTSRPTLTRRNTYHRPSHFQAKKSDVARMPSFNKETAFTEKERNDLNLRGLLPPRIETMEEQLARAYSQFSQFDTPLEKHIYLNSLAERNETLYYALIIDNLKETMSVIYTPTVGEACLKFGLNFRRQQGMYFCPNDKGYIRRMLDNWTHKEVDIIVITDGSRILGLGDLGTNGMGIPIGKLALYVAAAGFHPTSTLPVMLDVGTNNESLLASENYLGLRQKRVSDEIYDDLIEEFMAAVKEKWPGALVQFEDFSNDHAFSLLEKYRGRYLCFNDDIQGTGAVVLSGLLNAVRVAETTLSKSTFVFYGAGSAGVGVADVIVAMMQEEGLSKHDALRRFWFVDSRGLVTNNRGDTLAEHKVPYARDDVTEQQKDLLDIIKSVKPTGLIGLAGQGPHFTEDIIKEMASNNERPIIFALSNPTDKAECSATDAYVHTDGKAVFASGSPFDPVEFKGKIYTPGQGNNMFVFPGLGMGAHLAKATCVTDKMVLSASKALAALVPDEEIKNGNIYPDVGQIRAISLKVAAAVFQQAVDEGVATLDSSERGDMPLEEWIGCHMYEPIYFPNL